MTENKDAKMKSGVDKVILSLCSRIGLGIEGSKAFTVCEVVEFTTALATLIEARVKLDENARTIDLKSKSEALKTEIIEMLKTKIANCDC